MPQPIQQPIVPTPEQPTELETLRTVNASILAKRKRDKAKIAQLEIDAVALQDKTTKAESAAHNALIGLPLRQMAETVSDVPELFLAEFAKHYTIDADKTTGRIAITTIDGQPALDTNGKQAEFTPHSLYNLLASQAVIAGGSKDARSKIFAVLMKYFGASGAAGIGGNQRTRTTAGTGQPAYRFGLR